MSSTHPKPAKRTSLARQGLLLLSIPIICQLLLLGGFLLLVRSTTASATEHEARTRYSACWGIWLANYSSIANQAAYGIIYHRAINVDLCKRHEEEMSKAYPLIAKDGVFANDVNVLKKASSDISQAIKNVAWGVQETKAQAEINPQEAERVWQWTRAHATNLNNTLVAFAEQYKDDSVFTTADTDTSRRQLFARLLTGASVANVVIFLVLALVFNRRIISRLRQMGESTRALAARKSLDVPVSGTDELSQFHASLAAMAKAVDTALHVESSLINNAQAVIVSLEPSGRVTQANNSTLRLLGVPADAMAGKFILDFVLEEEQQQAADFLRACQSKGEAEFELQMRAVDGSVLDTLWSIAWSDADNCLFAIIHDNSVYKSAERLEHQVVQMVSHDIRGPLAAIRNFYEMLEANMLGTLTDAGKEMLDISKRNADRMVLLTNDLLAFGKISDGALKLNIADADLDDVCRSAAEVVEWQAAQKSIPLQIAVEPITVKVDAQRITQVLINLLTNAIKFTPDNGRVSVSAKREGDVVIIQVSDTGRGIPASEIASVYDRFRQVSGDDATVYSGKGLGLAICKALVELHSGSIAVASEPGRGTTFTLTLPMVAQNVVNVAETRRTLA